LRQAQKVGGSVGLGLLDKTCGSPYNRDCLIFVEEIKMAKAKISKKQKKFSAAALKKFEPNQELLGNKKLVIETLMEALCTNDIETFRDVLIAHLRTLSKTELAKRTGLGRRTLYDLIEAKKFDPRLSTLSALLSKIAA
jgi:DNA-binding phage protein